MVAEAVTMDATPCSELLERARAGNHRAWAELDARVREPLRRYASRLTGARWPHLSVAASRTASAGRRSGV